MKSGDEKSLILELHHEAIARATTITGLRAKLSALEIASNEMELAQAEAAVPLQALNEFTDYLLERTRAERDARSEMGLWTRSAGSLGNSIALTLYQDLCAKLDKIRSSYGV